MEIRYFIYSLLAILLSTSCSKKNKIVKVERFENGDTLSVFVYDSSQFCGNYRIYYDGSRIKEKGEFFTRSKEKKVIEYFENGSIMKYSFYKNSDLIYFKEYDENGNLIANQIAVISPKETYESTVNIDDSILLRYSLLHTMYNDAYIAIVIRNLKNDRVILNAASDTTLFEYYLKGFDEGENIFEINIYEALEKSDSVKGYYGDTLEIIGIPVKKSL